MKRLTDRERYYIQKQLEKKVSVSQIAADLGYSRGAIYYEIKRGTCEQIDTHLRKRKVYCWDYAAADAKSKQNHRPNKKLAPDNPYLLRCVDLIKNKKYSPYAAMQIIGETAPICEVTLYSYIESGYILGIETRNLPYAKPRKKKRKHQTGKRKEFESGKKSIELRPAEVSDRQTYGHWEMDTVYSSKDDLHCLLVLSERKYREEIIIKIRDRTMQSVIKALDSMERKLGAPAFREKFKTITCDNGMEFADWKSIERSSRNKGKRTEVYFAHPYCSGERGTNENENKMIRRWIPKGDDIGLYSDEEIAGIMEWINTYPRKMFGGLSSRNFALT